MLRRYRSWLWYLTCIHIILAVAFAYAYLAYGWFESATLGKVQHRRRIYVEGPHFVSQKPFGLFPRAEGLLKEPFKNNAWTIESADGFSMYESKPTWWHVPLAHIPTRVRAVFLFSEDRLFYNHPGVDLKALFRAAYISLTSLGNSVQGGSTIAMQVAKHCLLEYGERPTRSLVGGPIRKIREALLALRLTQVEGRYRILDFYFNHAYLGRGSYGIGPASHDFFRKKPQRLTLGQAAWLAVQLPSPKSNPRTKRFLAQSERRRRRLLQSMHDAGLITTRDLSRAKKRVVIYPPVLLSRRTPTMSAPQSAGAVFHAIEPIIKRFGLPGAAHTVRQLAPYPPFPLHIRTSVHATLSWRLYDAARPVITRGISYAAIVLVDGKPAALLGGAPYVFNYALQARRQVGSVSKLFFYDVVWRKGFVTPNTLIEDSDMPKPRRKRKLYRPRNNDGRLHGKIQHKVCLSRSMNKCSYRSLWGERTWRERKSITRSLIRDFAFPWQQKAVSERRFMKNFMLDESVPLGTWSATPWEVAAMLEKGFRDHVLTLNDMIDSWNGKLNKQTAQPSTPVRGLSRPLALALAKAVRATAPKAIAKDPDFILAAKTGTTDGGRDSWFAGFILQRKDLNQKTIRPRITFVVWAGYPDNRAAGLYGGEVHGPVFGRFLQNPRVQTALRTLLERRSQLYVRRER